MTEPDSGTLKWKSHSPDDILWAHFDEDYIAFQRSSGKTHFLNVASYVLLEEILSEPCDLGTVADEFMAEGQEASRAQYLGQMKEMLCHLESLGLVHRVR